MTLSVVILDSDEKFIQFLDKDLLTLTENHETYSLRTLKVEYNIESIEEAQKLFRHGYKIFVSGDPSLTDCLYVINSNVEKDLFKENQVNFEAEEVLVELNYAPPFLQTEVTSANGFTINKQNSQDYVKVNYYSLNYWFGDYFQIGIVQDCLTVHASKIAPRGIMSKMELLRFIENETSNVFRTRYEKDPQTNVIHRYLDFLNPDSSTTAWELFLNYNIPEVDDLSGTLVDENNNTISTDDLTLEEERDGIEDEEDEVIFPEEDEVTYYTPSELTFKLLNQNGTVLGSWNGATIGVAASQSNLIRMAYNPNDGVVCQCNGKTFANVTNTVEAPEIYSDFTNENSYPFTSIANDPNKVSVVLGNHSTLQVLASGVVIHEQSINPLIGDVHSEVLDLGYNLENVKFDVDESDTFNSIMPILSLSGENDTLSKTDMDNIINAWVNLEVNKGDVIPMIIEKVTTTGTKTTGVTNNYYSKPCNPNDNPDNNQYEYWAAVAYRTAPFNKRAGEPFIYDDTITGIDYTHIKQRPNVNDTRADQPFTPKIGPVETSDEDPYAIYNDVAMKLKDKKYPNVTVNVDVANYKNKKFNDYQLWDKVYLKLPGYNELITARVNSISKNSNDLAENNVTLGTYSINTIVPQMKTILYGDNVNFIYPAIGVLTVQLKDYNETALPNKLLTFNVTSNDQSASENQIYNVTTDSQGYAKVNLQLNPGQYNVGVYYGGDELYEPVSAKYDVSVGGTLPVPVQTPSTAKANKTSQKKAKKQQKTKKTKTKTKTKTTKTYWSKYGLSPDKKRIIAIGRPSSTRDTGSYTFYEQEFENWCPHCHKRTLKWGIFWAGNETSNWGKFPATGNREGSSAEGAIFCTNQNCDADYSCQGNEHGGSGAKLRALTKKKKSSKSKAYKLRKGNLEYGTKKVTVKVKKNNKKTENRATPINSGVSKKIKEKALKIVGKKKDLAAAKEIAKFMGKDIRYEQVKSKVSGFTRSPENVLSAGMGNCCSQTRLMLELWDAAGVTNKYKLYYIHVSNGHDGHVFARIVSKATGKGVYVDPCKRNPWGNWVKGYGRIGSRPGSKYPTLPW